jgi:hypothetical protein
MGGFYRVRYTGRPVYMPRELHVTKSGIYITFTQPLDRSSAESVSNYSLARWNYRWSAAYGSDLFKRNGEKGKEQVPIQSARLEEDGRTVFLGVPDMTEIMQMHTKYDIRAADGTRAKAEIYHTVNSLSSKKGEAMVALYPPDTKTTSSLPSK